MRIKNGRDEYVMMIAPPDFPGSRYHKDRYCYEHHLVFWQHYGIVPQKGELIHHKNEIKIDNRPENLALKSLSGHSREHALTKAAALPEEHGTLKQYRRGCRCHLCRTANSAHVNEFR